MTKTICNILLLLFLIWPHSLLLAAAESKQSDYTISELFRYREISRSNKQLSIGAQGGIFFKIRNNKGTICLNLTKPGNYSLDDFAKLSKEDQVFESFACSLMALLLRFKSPAELVIISDPRGKAKFETKMSHYFEEIWKEIVANPETEIPASNIMAAGLWYAKEKNNFTRSAYLLEQAYHKSQSKWIFDLQQEAAGLTSLSKIKKEVEETRILLNNLYAPEKNLALLIGVQNYKNNNFWKKLETPLSDILMIKKVLIENYHFKSENIILLKDPSYQEILKTLSDLKSKITEENNLLVYYAGHGNIDEDGEYFWIPADAGNSPDSWIYTNYILNKIKKFNTLHTVVLVDSCFSGALNSHQSRSSENIGWKKLYQKRSRQLITAGGIEPVADSDGRGHSVFAGNLLKILDRQPINQPLSIDQLFSELQPKVTANSNQTPTYDRIADSDDQWGQFYFVKNPTNFIVAGKSEVQPSKDVMTRKANIPSDESHILQKIGLGVTFSSILQGTLVEYVLKSAENLNFRIALLNDGVVRKSSEKDIKLELSRNMALITYRYYTEFYKGLFFGGGLGYYQAKQSFVNQVFEDENYELNGTGSSLIAEIGIEYTNIAYFDWTELENLYFAGDLVLAANINHQDNYQQEEMTDSRGYYKTATGDWAAVKNSSLIMLGIGWRF